jgi:hypothetical protein
MSDVDSKRPLQVRNTTALQDPCIRIDTYVARSLTASGDTLAPDALAQAWLER